MLEYDIVVGFWHGRRSCAHRFPLSRVEVISRGGNLCVTPDAQVGRISRTRP